MSKKIRLTGYKVGEIELGDTVDITDPGYDKDVWCRLDDVKIVPGKYSCMKYTHTFREKWDDGKIHPDTRVFIAGIYHDDIVPNPQDFEEIGTIGVDAGMAGFFPNKRDFDDQEWSDFCNKVYKGNAWLIEDGFCTASGYGDGGYPVFAAKDDSGRAVALEIRY